MDHVFEINLERFWKENKESLQKPFSTNKPRVAVNLPFDNHWLIGEMKVPSTVRYFSDPDYAEKINAKCNDRMEAEIGIRPFGEHFSRVVPKRIEEVFGCRFELTEGGTPWLESDVKSIDDLKKIMKDVEKLDLEKFVLPDEWYADCERLEREFNIKISLGKSSRGPATIGTSVCGTMNLLLFLIDYPEVMDDFYTLLGEKMIEYYTLLREKTGYTKRGFAFNDDNCSLFSPELYERFCYPVMERVFQHFAPVEGDLRHQHSDSDMGHLLLLLNSLGINSTNFGPTVLSKFIREKMPRAMISGQIPPMLLRNGTPEEIIEAVRSDIEDVGSDGGLVISTAGSIAEGTTLYNVKVLMYAVEKYGRYK